MSQRNTLLCTLGTSLFGNLTRLHQTQQSNPTLEALAAAFDRKDWPSVSSHMIELDPTDRACGAEINSVNNLTNDEAIEPVNLHLLHSNTDDGLTIAKVLKSYFEAAGWNNVQCHTLDGLQDDDPRRFRTEGLRNLAKKCGELVRAAGGSEFCAINATGGYKAQIAIAVLIGQALGVPVYYKHELFPIDSIISFPPMPVALDFSLWEQASGMFMALSRTNAAEPWELFQDDWDERFEPLVNRTIIDGKDYLELSPAGQIFHETFHQRFQQSKTSRLPSPANPENKTSPSLGEHGYGRARGPIEGFLQKVTDEVPYVLRCHTTYWDPDLPQTSRFRQSSHGVEGIYSDGSWCVKFAVETTAESNELTNVSGVVVADLNDWLSNRS